MDSIVSGASRANQSGPQGGGKFTRDRGVHVSDDLSDPQAVPDAWVDNIGTDASQNDAVPCASRPAHGPLDKGIIGSLVLWPCLWTDMCWDLDGPLAAISILLTD